MHISIYHTLKYTLNSWHVTYKAPTRLGPLPCELKIIINKVFIKDGIWKDKLNNAWTVDTKEDEKSMINWIN